MRRPVAGIGDQDLHRTDEPVGIFEKLPHLVFLGKIGLQRYPLAGTPFELPYHTVLACVVVGDHTGALAQKGACDLTAYASRSPRDQYVFLRKSRIHGAIAFFTFPGPFEQTAKAPPACSNSRAASPGRGRQTSFTGLIQYDL
mgnify:CR=1 FL=1